MENILVPVDFSPISEAASSFAIRLASSLNCEIIYIHLLESRAEEIQRTKDRNNFHRDVLKEVADKTGKMEEFSRIAAEHFVKADHILNYDREYTSLIDFAAKNNSRLILMGTHGISGTRELLKGSHSQAVARISNIPVIVIKEGYSERPIKKIAFVSDFIEDPGSGFEGTLQLARELNLELHLVHINTPGHFTGHRDSYQRMSKYLNGNTDVIKVTELFNAYEIEEGIEEYCDYYGIDMISVVTHTKEETSSVFLSSVNEKLINHLKFPILSLHD